MPSAGELSIYWAVAFTKKKGVFLAFGPLSFYPLIQLSWLLYFARSGKASESESKSLQQQKEQRRNIFGYLEYIDFISFHKVANGIDWRRHKSSSPIKFCSQRCGSARPTIESCTIAVSCLLEDSSFQLHLQVSGWSEFLLGIDAAVSLGDCFGFDDFDAHHFSPKLCLALGSLQWWCVTNVQRIGASLMHSILPSKSVCGNIEVFNELMRSQVEFPSLSNLDGPVDGVVP